jgi:hypothetical protein
MLSLIVSAATAALGSIVAIVEPFRKKDNLIQAVTVGTWCVALPTIITATGAPEDYLSDNVTFLYVKLWSVAVGVASSSFFKFIAPKIIKDASTERIARNAVLSTILALNIGEATVKQAFFMENPELVDYVNSLCGTVLVVTTFLSVYKKPIEIYEDEAIVQLECNYGPGYITGYTLWNILFVTRVAPEISFPMFVLLSHAVGIMCHITDYADWLDVRSQTLLMYIILKFGLTPEHRFYPEFFDPSDQRLYDMEYILGQGWYTLSMAALVLSGTVWSCAELALVTDVVSENDVPYLEDIREVQV